MWLVDQIKSIENPTESPPKMLLLERLVRRGPPHIEKGEEKQSRAPGWPFGIQQCLVGPPIKVPLSMESYRWSSHSKSSYAYSAWAKHRLSHLKVLSSVSVAPSADGLGPWSLPKTSQMAGHVTPSAIHVPGGPIWTLSWKDYLLASRHFNRLKQRLTAYIEKV